MSPWYVDGDGRVRWECPRCGGNCFGSWAVDGDALGTLEYVCHGHADGQSETGACGYRTREPAPNDRTVERG